MVADFITDIGDSGLLGGISFAGAAYCFLAHRRKEALALLMSFVGAAVLAGMLKLFLLGCAGYLPEHYGIRSPSGHAALSVSVVGTYALLVSLHMQGRWRWLPLTLFALLATGIAVTRVTLGYHSAPEVIIGLLVGSVNLICVCIFLEKHTPFPEINFAMLAAIIMPVALLLHGIHFPAEDVVHALAHYLRHNITVCARS